MTTDLLLAIVAGGLGWVLLGAAGSAATLRGVWGLAFVATALAAATGGVFHGFRARLGEKRADRLWRATLLLSVVSAFLLLAGQGFGLRGAGRLWLLAIAVTKLVAATRALTRGGSFFVVALDAGVSLLLILVIALWQMAAGEGGGWVAAGAGVALLGAATQRRPWHGPGGFNHNDLFHLAQMAACYLLFRGAMPL